MQAAPLVVPLGACSLKLLRDALYLGLGILPQLASKLCRQAHDRIAYRYLRRLRSPLSVLDLLEIAMDGGF